MACINCGDLHDSLMNRDDQKTSKKSRNYNPAFMEIFPLCQLYSSSLDMSHTAQLVAQEAAISFLWGGHVSPHLDVARACFLPCIALKLLI